jgi:hypothetical protein
MGDFRGFASPGILAKKSVILLRSIVQFFRIPALPGKNLVPI